MFQQRHPNHDKIVEALLRGAPNQTVQRLFKASASTVKAIKADYIDVKLERKFDPGEGQLSFFKYFPRKRR